MADDSVRSEETFDEQYAWYEPATVISQSKVPLPGVVQAELQNDERLMGPAVAWGYAEDTDAGWAILSHHALKKDGYESVAYNELEKPAGSTTYARPPEDIRDRFGGMFDQGSELVYIATQEMIDDNPSTWLVERWRLLRALPGGGDDSELKQMLSRNPGFLPSL
jgi:hypothetical protein